MQGLHGQQAHLGKESCEQAAVGWSHEFREGEGEIFVQQGLHSGSAVSTEMPWKEEKVKVER